MEETCALFIFISTLTNVCFLFNTDLLNYNWDWSIAADFTVVSAMFSSLSSTISILGGKCYVALQTAKDESELCIKWMSDNSKCAPDLYDFAARMVNFGRFNSLIKPHAIKQSGRYL